MSDLYGVPRSRIVGETWFWVAMLFALVIALMAIIFGIRWLTAGPRGKLQAREQIQSGANRIQAYNHFFDLCASVQTMEQALNQSYVDLKSASGYDRTRIETNITAQLNSRNDAANQYNADSQKDYTVGQFKASKLPYTLPTYTKGVVTSCAA